MCETLTIEDIVYWEARKRIPDELNGKHFFGAYDIWHYIDTQLQDNECETCKRFHSFDFTGNMLRSYFPDLTVESENIIYPNVHRTLWGTDTCKCLLIRVTNNPDFEPSKVLTYQGPKIQPYMPEPKKIEPEEPEPSQVKFVTPKPIELPLEPQPTMVPYIKMSNDALADLLASGLITLAFFILVMRWKKKQQQDKDKKPKEET